MANDVNGVQTPNVPDDNGAQVNPDNTNANPEEIKAELEKLKTENEQLQQLRDLVFSDETLFDAVVKKAKGEPVTISTGETTTPAQNNNDVLPSPPDYFNPNDLSDPNSESSKWLSQAIQLQATSVAKKEIEILKQDITAEQKKNYEKMQYEQMFKEIAQKEGLSLEEQQQFRQWVEKPKDMSDYLQSAIKAWKVSTNKVESARQTQQMVHPPVNAVTVGGAPIAPQDANEQFWTSFKQSYERLKNKV